MPFDHEEGGEPSPEMQALSTAALEAITEHEAFDREHWRVLILISNGQEEFSAMGFGDVQAALEDAMTLLEACAERAGVEVSVFMSGAAPKGQG